MEDFDEREEELSTLSAIYPELSIDPTDAFSASLELPVTPAQPLLVRFIPSASSERRTKTFHLGFEAENAAYVEHDVVLTHLPPLSLKATLPKSYPADSPPQVQLSTQHDWLPQQKLSDLENDAQRLWDEYGHCQTLFVYIDHLQQAAERGFDLDQTIDGCLVLPMFMEPRLVSFNSDTKQAVFDAGTYDCGICLEPKKGSECYQLKDCGHIFCRQCFKDFYNSAIKEGDVAGVRCLALDCGKGQKNGGNKKTRKPRSISPRELLAMGIEEDVVRRYVELKRKKKMEADKNTIYCPRQWCQGAARRKEYPPIPADLSQCEADSSSDEDGDYEAGQEKTSPNGTVKLNGVKVPANPADRLAICEKCQYAFCRVCYSGWHGEFARCHPRDPNELSAEDKASYDWINTHTSPCPTCGSPTQKIMGCNHMKCFQCNTHFCYLCGAWLDGGNPYIHFNTRGMECYQRLFELEEGDEGQAPQDGRGFAGPRRWEALALEVAREAEAQEAAAALQAEEDARAQREPRAWEDGPAQLAIDGNAAADPMMFLFGNMRLEGQPNGGPDRADNANGARRRRRAVPAHPPAEGAANAVRNHERNRGGANAGRGGRIGAGQPQGPPRPMVLLQDRGNAELRRFIQMAQRDEEDGWDIDDLGDDDDRVEIR